jgi:hypothetical protein
VSRGAAAAAAVAVCAAGVGAAIAGPSAPSAAGTFADQATLRGGAAGFGASVALSRNGGTALVGAPEAKRSFLFERLGTTWVADATLRADSSRFGAAVALSAAGRIALIGAPGADGGKGEAWIYRTQGGGTWVGQRLTPSGRSGAARFGSAVALSDDGSTVVVGGPADSSERGAVWVFERSGASWKQQGGKLTARDELRKGELGSAVAVSADGNTALLGGPGDTDRGGAAWFFKRTGKKWSQDGDKFWIRSTTNKARFGSSVALAGDGRTAFVGVPGESKSKSGFVDVIERVAGRWKEAARLHEPPVTNQPRHDGFGSGVALSTDGSTGLVRGHSGPNLGVGAVWVFTRGTGSRWGDDQRLSRGPSFGPAVALSGDAQTALVGEPTRDDERAHVFAVPPVVSRISPTAGPVGGGTEVTLTGSNLFGVRSVTFGSKPASFRIFSATEIRAVAPPGAAGTVEVTATNRIARSPATSAARFTYLEPPVVTAVDPASGPVSGGTTVTITGSNFPSLFFVRRVNFGTSAVTSFSTSPGRIVVISPPGQPGTVDVTVTTAGGTSTPTPAARFTYRGTSNETVVGFDDLTTGGRGATGTNVMVGSQFAAQGVTFNDLLAVDYSKPPSPIAGFAHSGTVALEPCPVGVEFCTTPVRGTFAAPQALVRVWVGLAFAPGQSLRIDLRALNAASAVVGTASATLGPSTSEVAIQTPLEVRAADITQFEVAVAGGINNGLAVDDVTFAGS